MCGIAGFVDFNFRTEPSVIKKMTDSIIHRGPDSSGEFVSKGKNAVLGIRRLSIIDLKTGDQPITNEDGSIAVVYNGEIYNYQKLKKDLQKRGHKFKTKTDTEVIVHGYEEWGEGVAQKLNGMFAFAIWDENQQELLIGRDRSGIKPLYYFIAKNLLVFGSEPKTILQHPLYKKNIDKNALLYYFYLGFLPGEISMFDNIKKLLSGHTLSFNESSFNISKYFQLSLSDRYCDAKYTNNLDYLDKLLNNSVKSQLVADVPVGVFLSGGLDSSLVSYYASRHKKIKSFSIGFDEPGYDESEHAHYVAKILGTEHYSEQFKPSDVTEIFGKVIEELDEPFSDPSIIPTFKVNMLARRHVKVALSGDGGDELFGGYPTYQAHILNKYLGFLPEPFFKVMKRVVDIFPDRLFDLIPLSFKDYPKKKLAKIVLTGVKLPQPERHLYFMRSFFLGETPLMKIPDFRQISNELPDDYGNSPILGGQVVDYFTYLRDDFLVKADRASMYNSLEVRVPYLDNELIDFAFTGRHKHADMFKTKIMLRALIKSKLPEIAKRYKKGFGIPFAKWVRGDLKDFSYDMLSNRKLYSYLEKKDIERLWSEHQEEKENNAGVLWQLIVFSGWLNNYL